VGHKEKLKKKKKIHPIVWWFVALMSNIFGSVITSVTESSLLLRLVAILTFWFVLILLSYVAEEYYEANIVIFVVAWILFSMAFPVFQIVYQVETGELIVSPMPPFTELLEVGKPLAIIIVVLFYFISVYCIGYAYGVRRIDRKVMKGLEFVGFMVIFMMTHEMGHVILFGEVPRAVGLVFPMMAYVDIDFTGMPLAVLLVGLLGGILINSVEARYMCILAEKFESSRMYNYAYILYFIVVTNLLPIKGTDGYYFLLYATNSLSVLGSLLYIFVFLFFSGYLGSVLLITKKKMKL